MKLGRLSWQENSTELDRALFLFFSRRYFASAAVIVTESSFLVEVMFIARTPTEMSLSQGPVCAKLPMEGICHLWGC